MIMGKKIKYDLQRVCLTQTISLNFRAKDVKEKFSFLRRRHTDTSLSSKMGGDKSSGKNSNPLTWTKSFETLLSDKCKYMYLTLFRDGPFFNSFKESIRMGGWFIIKCPKEL